MNKYYFVITTVSFWLLFSIWSRKNWGDFALKVAFLGLALWGSFIVIKTF